MASLCSARKAILSTNFGPFEAQVSGDYVGRRPVTYLNDLSVGGTFLTGLEASYLFDRPTPVATRRTRSRRAWAS